MLLQAIGSLSLPFNQNIVYIMRNKNTVMSNTYDDILKYAYAIPAALRFWNPYLAIHAITTINPMTQAPK